GLFGDDDFYNRLSKPPLAPPDRAFAPGWLVLNVTSLIALYLVANLPAETAGRATFLVSEAIGWVLFAAFTSLYFGLKSPTLGAVDTVLGLAAAGVSLWCATRLGTWPFWLILPRVLWLLLASYVSVGVVWLNRGG
ncbi:MAG: TspO/MBR family protein, partial [Planctomycetota bacterium]